MTETQKERLTRTVNFLRGKFSHLLNGGGDKTSTLIINGREIYYNASNPAGRRVLDVKKLISDVEKIQFPSEYKDNPFTSSDIRYSPLEADKSTERNDGVWKNTYSRIDFPKMMPLFLTYILLFGELPSVVDLVQIFIGVYMEVVPSGEEIADRKSYYRNPNAEDRLNLGNTLHYVDGTPIENKLLRFQAEFANSTYPFNEFTTEHICSRILKSYASLIRDVITPLKFTCLSFNGESSVYNMYEDLKEGIDLTYNGAYILSSTSTPNARTFDGIKMEDLNARHNFIRVGDKAVRIKMEVLGTKGIVVPCGEDIERVIKGIDEGKYKVQLIDGRKKVPVEIVRP